MELTFTNVLLLLALVAVSLAFGFRIGHTKGKRDGYGEGHADGMSVGEQGIIKYLTQEELIRVRRTEKAEVVRELRENGMYEMADMVEKSKLRL